LKVISFARRNKLLKHLASLSYNRLLEIICQFW